jgi:plasmid stabilization system protein ParE
MSPQLRLFFAPAARRDIRDEALYLTIHGSEEVSDRFVEAVEHIAMLLCATPGIGNVFPLAAGGLKEFRSFPVSGSFGKRLIVYSFGRDTLRVERVVRGSRNLGRLFQP